MGDLCWIWYSSHLWCRSVMGVGVLEVVVGVVGVCVMLGRRVQSVWLL